jgi:hypothetical protein
MKRWRWWTAGIAGILIIAGLAWAAWHRYGIRGTDEYYIFRPPKQAAAVGGGLPDFTLLDHAGVIHSLRRQGDAKAVVFVGHSLHCASFDAGVLDSLKAAEGVSLFFINPDDAREELLKAKPEIPVLMDPSRLVTEELRLKGAGDAVIVDPSKWEIVYRGRVDENFRAAVNSVRQGRPAGEKGTEAAPGECAYGSASVGPFSYEHDVAPVLIEKCLSCHAKESRFTPFFDSYESVQRWAAMIRETILTERMPPFSADTLYGKFRNDISLTPDEKRMLVTWIDQGMEKRGGDDPLAGYHARDKNETFMRNHKLIHSAGMAQPITVPPGGTIEYQYFQLGGKVPRDLWVTAVYSHTTNPRQLHHESLMIVPKPLKFYEDMPAERDAKADATNMDGDIPIYVLTNIKRYVFQKNEQNYMRVQNWGAGRKQPFRFGKGEALHIPKGYYLVLEAHYMGTGKKETEQTTLDFYGDFEPHKRKQMHSMMVHMNKINITPNAKRTLVESRPFDVPNAVDLNHLLPHLHMRGKSIKLIETDATGASRTLLSVPNFYYGWQTGSGLLPDPPIHVAKGKQLKVICEYDNSPQNPNNPNPNKTVHFGQTIDRTEMCLMNISYTDAD